MLIIANYFRHKWHAWVHLIHGWIPWWQFFERKVSSPDFDHQGKTDSRFKDYWDHLLFNLRCRKIHIIKGRHRWIKEVEIK